MGSKSKKRDREEIKGESIEEVPVKRRRQFNEEQLKLSKLYDDLAAEEDDTRLEAAKQLIVKFSPENKPAAQDVKSALIRLIKGLCSQRKAARMGFSLTLTELLRQIFGQEEMIIEGLDLNVPGVIKLVEEKTKVEGNVPGRERRDHLIGRLFGYKAVLQSSIAIVPELSMECWAKLMDNIYGMARDIPWLREECGMVLVEAVKSLQGQSLYKDCAKATIDRLSTFKLAHTPEGVAIWLTVQADYEAVLPDNIWYGKDPLSRKERSRLAKALRENYHEGTGDGNDGAIKSAAASPNPSFAWNLVLSESLRRDTGAKPSKDDISKGEFAQFWIDIVDNNLFTTTSSHERKAWGFKILSSMVFQTSEATLAGLFSPNLMRTLINQSKKEDRYLHSAALAALNSIPTKAQQDPLTAPALFVALTSKTGNIDFDKVTKTKTLEQILLSADDSGLKKIVRHLNSLILRPDTDDQSLADNRRQTIADLLLNTIKHYKRYDSMASSSDEEDNWLHKTLNILVDHAYFVPNQSVKTSKVPLPSISERNRQMFQERLASCLTKLLDVGLGSRSKFTLVVVQLIQSKKMTSKSLDPAFKTDEQVSQTLEKACHILDTISTKGSIAGSKTAAEGFILLYSLTLLQIYNGEGDAVLMLDDLDTARKTMLKKSKDSTTSESSNAFAEIVLSFIGNPLTLFRKIGTEAFSIFAAEVGAEGLQSLTDVLDTEENLEGQKELFNQGEEDDEEGSESSDDSEEASDVEMISGDEPDSDGSDDSSNGSDDSDESDDEELTHFNNMLAITLQTSKANMDGDAAEETSDESDMDDEQMMALDPHLSKIFQQRSKTTSKKKEREDAKQNMVQFKSRVLDLLSIYFEKQYSNPLGLNALLPIIRRTRANASKQLSEKASKMLRTHFDSRKKHKAPLPKPKDVEVVWELLKEIHEEAKQGGGSKIHADACSSASLHVVKILVGLDRSNYSGIVDIYANTQKDWFMDRKTQLQPALFTLFQNWSLSARQSK